jgi:hypothetical protein
MPHLIPEAIRVFSAAQGATCVFLIIAERIIASWFLDSYEHTKHTGVVYLVVVGTIPVSGVATFFGMFLDVGNFGSFVGFKVLKIGPE